MNTFRLKFVSIVLAGILLPQAAQASMDIVDIPVDQFINSGDTFKAASNEVIVKLKEGKEIPSMLLEQTLEKGTYTLTELESVNALVVKSATLTSTALIELFEGSQFKSYIDSVELNEQSKPATMGDGVKDANSTFKFAENEILVTLNDNMSIPMDIMSNLLKAGGEYKSAEYKNINTLFVKSTSFTAGKLSELFESEMMKKYIKSVSFNYQYKAEGSSDTHYNNLWAIENTGQSVNNTSGLNDADMDIAEAWEKTKGSKDVVVAVLDTGVDYSHTDLADNMWQGNAHHGFDFAGNNDGDNDDNPMPDTPYGENGHYHGTHVAGTIGAVGDNSDGVSGVAQNVSIMAVKVFRPDGYGYSNDILEAVNYVLEQIDNGVNIVAVNASYGGGGSQNDAMNDAIKKLGEKGVVFCAAAGNEGKNIDEEPMYPASYNASNIIAVAATDQSDKLASFSNYGVNSVDVAAPGTNILSTYPENKYAYLNGTSMATPHVAGAIALLATQFPESTAVERKAMILDHVDTKDALANSVATSGRVNINESLVEKEEEAKNIAPVAAKDTAKTAYETAVTVNVLVNDSDEDGDTLSIKSFTEPEHGKVVEKSGQLVYTPADGFSGTDTFDYVVTDGELDDTSTVTVAVDKKPNEAPVAQDDTATTAYNKAVTIEVLANDSDVDGDTLSVASVSQPEHGTVSYTENTLTYAPDDNFSGEDTFTYTIADGNGAETTANVTVKVDEEPNQAPVAKDDATTTAYQTAVTIAVLLNDTDTDSDNLSIQSFTQPNNGKVVQENGKLVYTPADGFSGQDGFEYVVADGELSDSAKVTVTVEEDSSSDDNNGTGGNNGDNDNDNGDNNGDDNNGDDNNGTGDDNNDGDNNGDDNNGDDSNNGDDNDGDSNGDNNDSDKTWFELPEQGVFANFFNKMMGNGLRAETQKGSGKETFVGKFTKDNTTTLITSYISQTKAKIFNDGEFAIVGMGDGQMQLKIDGNGTIMPRMPRVEDAVLPENPLPVGTSVEIRDEADVKFTFTMTENIKF